MPMYRTSIFIFGSLSLLLVPFFAMQFAVEGWDWHLFDYVVVGIILAGIGWSLAFATNGASLKRRVIGVALVTLLVATYVHLAVGLVDWLPFAGS